MARARATPSFTFGDSAPRLRGWNVQPFLAPTSRRGEIHTAKPHNGCLPTCSGLVRPVLTIASGNPNKVAEIVSMLGPLALEVRRQPDDLDVEETGATYLENARLKAVAAARRTGCWSLADDSGLEVDALGGAPGLFTARLAPTDSEKIQRLLEALEGDPYRSACFRSAMVLCSPEGQCLEEAEGVCWGELLKAPAFSGGGIESLFWVREANCSYGELNPSQLARLGSRGKAARALAPRLRERLGLNR